MTIQDTVIRVRGLRKRYPGTAEPAVDGIDLDVRAGEVVALLGPNGAGKTTTVEILEGYRRQAVQAELAVDPGTAQRHLELAVRTARENLAEARALVAGGAPGEGPLPDALRRQCVRLTERTGGLAWARQARLVFPHYG